MKRYFVHRIAVLCGIGALVNIASAADVDDPARIARAASVVAEAARPDEPGCAVGAYHSGRALLHSAYGLADLSARTPLTPQSVFGAASISKQFTAAAAAIAAEQGYLSLDDDIRKYLTELPDYGHKVVVRDLIHHVSGLRDFNHLVKLTFKPDLYQDKKSILALIARQQHLNFVPRAEFSYNNSGYLLLAEIVERATQRSLQTFATENIFKPLGMTHTYFAQGAQPDALRAQPYSKTASGWQPTAQENLITPGPGGLMTTVDDYHRWAANLMGAKSLLSGGEALQKRLRETAVLNDGSRTEYAFGLETAPYKGNEALSHGGSGLGYKTYAMLFPTHDLVIVGLCNNGAYADSLVMNVADALLGIAASPAMAGSVAEQSGTTALSAYTGFYRDPALALPRIVTLRDGTLHMAGDVVEHTLRRVANNRFQASGVKGEFEFDVPAPGSSVSPRFRQLLPSLSSGTSRFERIAVVTPGRARLREYVGRYYSAELDTIYEVSLVEGRLAIVGGKDRPAPSPPAIVLAPTLDDEFVSVENRFIARFDRDRRQHVRGFKASAQFGWVRDIEFVRIESDAPASVEVARTGYGVLHVTARDYVGLGYGFAYEHAKDNFCLMAKHLVTVNGEQSKYFGAAGDATGNLASDFYARYYYGVDDAVRQRFETISTAAKDLIRGYVAGYNRYLANTAATARPVECRDAPWLRPMTLDDMLRMIQEKNALVSGAKMSQALVAAVPPGSVAANIDLRRVTIDAEEISQYGSNGWAFGREATANGRGLLFGNPHFPWQGDNRFYQVHLRIPGELDVMGATIPPLPVVGIGFNKDVAWTHTVSNAKRFTLFELELDPSDARRYLVDGQSLAMKPVTVSVEVREPNGEVTRRSHVFYETLYGPVVVLPADGLVWSAERAYALADVNRTGVGQIDAWLAIGKAHNVGEVRAAAAARVELPWINTLAADRHGDALYADFSRMPNVSSALLAACQPSVLAAGLAASKGLLVLDGSKASCNWISATSAPGHEVMPAANLPSVIRRDYVANSNDSYWLVNAGFRLPPLSPINGPAAVEQGLRTRIGLIDIEQRLAGRDGYAGNKVSAEIVRQMLFASRNYAAQLALDDVVRLCATQPSALVAGRTVDLSRACSVLGQWDRRDNLDSRGAALFREFWFRAEKIPDLYAVKFDPRDPIHTPRQLHLASPEVAQRLADALGEAVALLTEKGFAIDAPLGELQAVVRNGRRIAVSGAEGGLGVLNAMRSKPLSAAGYEPIHGTSYLQIATFDAHGPIVDAVLAYDQSIDPASDYYSVQTELFSRGALYRLPFTAEQIRADPGYRQVALPDDPVLHAAPASR